MERLDEIKEQFEYGIKNNFEDYNVALDDIKWLIQTVEQQQKKITHWKKCTDNEQKIAGKLQKKVETLTKALLGKGELSNQVEELTKDNAYLKQKLEDTVAFYNSKFK